VGSGGVRRYARQRYAASAASIEQRDVRDEGAVDVEAPTWPKRSHELRGL